MTINDQCDPNSLPTNRVFLGWDLHSLPALLEYCLSNYLVGQVLDLSEVMLVLPNRRAGRRFQELLLEHSEQKKIAITPPLILTIGALTSKILNLEPAPGYLVYRKLVWQQVLTDNQQLLQQLLPGISGASESSAILNLSEILERVYSDLTANLLTARMVSAHLLKLNLDADAVRWQVLDELLLKFKEELEKTVPDHLGQRIERLPGTVSISGNLIVAGCPDLSRLASQLLSKLNDQLTIVIFAPQSLETCFDAYGCLIKDCWQRPVVYPEQNHIHFVERSIDQVRLVSHILSDIKEQYTLTQISIASPIDTAMGMLANELQRVGINYHQASGTKASTMLLGLFIRSLADYIKDPSFENIACLCRHPAMLKYLSSCLTDQEKSEPATILAALDAYHMQHLPQTLYRQVYNASTQGKLVEATVVAINQLFAKLLQSKQTMEFVQSLAETIDLIFSDAEFKPAKTEQDCVAQIVGELLSLKNFSSHNFDITLLFELIVNLIGTSEIPNQPSGVAVDLLGWLELQLDDADCKLVLDFNEGNIPESIKTDWLLPDGLRSTLGMSCNQTRLARDCFLLSTLAKQTSTLHIIVPRQDISGEYTLISNLLFDLEQATVFPQLERFVSKSGLRFESDRNNQVQSFALPPQPVADKIIDSVSISGLSNYLICPYRFYLEQVLCLKESHDNFIELDPLNFGSFIHDVLAKFSCSDLVNSQSDRNIQEYFNDLLSQQSKLVFGTDCEPAVLVQIEQIRKRLQVFARKQAERSRQGWHIIASEWGWTKGDIKLETRAGILNLTGRIDRIDQYLDQPMYAVFDYKTGDKVKSADESHKKVDKKTGEITWINYQLAAYAYALKELKFPEQTSEPYSVGFINLSADLEKINFDIAPWSTSDLDDAWESMQRTGADILQQKFWPPKVLPSIYSPFYRLYGCSIDIAPEDSSDDQEVQEGGANE